MKANLIGVIILVVFGYCNSFGQTISRDSMAGEWVCKEVTVLNAEKMPTEMRNGMELMKKGFLGSRFAFNTNGIFTLTLPKDAPAITKELSFLNNEKWVLSAGNKIMIGKNLMEITINQSAGITEFYLTETFMKLRMEKSTPVKP